MTKFLPFYYDEKGFYQNDKSFMITGERVAFLTAFLNSSLFKWTFADRFPKLGDKGLELRKIFFDKIPVIQVDETMDNHFRELMLSMQQTHDDTIAKEIDEEIFDLYGLSNDERNLIGFIEIQ